jgi:dipeptidyl-peptidase III
LSHGKAAVAKLLLELQVRKSTADGDGAREFYISLTNPLPGAVPEMRDLVIHKKQVRLKGTACRVISEINGSIFYCSQGRCLCRYVRLHALHLTSNCASMQPNTFLEGDEVVLKEYPLTAAGAIESFIERQI